MNNKASNGAFATPTDFPKLSLPSINKQDVADETRKYPKAFKFGQVDHNMLMSRLYSTPFNKATSNQQYALDMSATSIHKPRIKKLDNPPPAPEPVVS